MHAKWKNSNWDQLRLLGNCPPTPSLTKHFANPYKIFFTYFLLKFQVICENLKAEKALMKESEVRLMQENKSLLEHQKSQNALVTNLQTLQVSYHCTDNKGFNQPPWWWQWKHLQKIELAFFQTLSYLFCQAQFVKSGRIFLELIFQDCIQVQEQKLKIYCCEFTFSIKRRIRTLYVGVVYWTSKECTKTFFS